MQKAVNGYWFPEGLDHLRRSEISRGSTRSLDKNTADQVQFYIGVSSDIERG